MFVSSKHILLRKKNDGNIYKKKGNIEGSKHELEFLLLL